MDARDLILTVLGPIATIVVPLVLVAFPPPADTRVCPDGYDLRTGVRRDGHYECWPRPVGDPEWDGTWQRSPDRSRQLGTVIDGRIWCALGSRAVVVDYRTVGCRRSP